ncbi:hypothetical protein N0V90_003508 [Kalmusia sp. IMI 367209]|nr:hypothetical protein N0V90_003508 [Kalmusia sp. IMI 367209]
MAPPQGPYTFDDIDKYARAKFLETYNNININIYRVEIKYVWFGPGDIRQMPGVRVALESFFGLDPGVCLVLGPLPEYRSINVGPYKRFDYWREDRNREGVYMAKKEASEENSRKREYDMLLEAFIKWVLLRYKCLSHVGGEDFLGYFQKACEMIIPGRINARSVDPAVGHVTKKLERATLRSGDAKE